MDYQAIRVETRGGVAVVTMNRPEVMNALNARMRAEITHAVLNAGQTARAVVLTGEGRAFCSGQDLSDAPAGGSLDFEAVLNESNTVDFIYRRMEAPESDRPRVNGSRASIGLQSPAGARWADYLGAVAAGTALRFTPR